MTTSDIGWHYSRMEGAGTFAIGRNPHKLGVYILDDGNPVGSPR